MKERLPAALVIALFVTLIAGLAYTQIIRYGYYARLAKNNSIRLVPIDGPRGRMLDRSGRPLVENRLAFDVALVYSELGDRGKLARVLAEGLGMSKREIIDALAAAGRKPYVPVVVAEDIGRERALVLEEATLDTPGLIIETRCLRSYPYGTVASHIIGYLSEASEGELDDLKEYGYRPRDLLGRGGLERYYEAYLKGIDGGTQVEIDSRGRHVRVLGVREPTSGRDLTLALDLDLQRACDTALGARRGAVVALHPKTGEVLALASHPAYDPNLFVQSGASDARVSLINDRKGRPLTDRAISGQYPPGSVFKIVTAAAALETRSIDASTTVDCSGEFRLGGATFDCWKKDGHGPQDILEAIAHSCNVFFYNAGRRAGVDALETYAKLFGFGRLSGIDLPDEAKGIAPGRAWKRSARKDDWYEGDTVNYSIGQGYLVVTPLQVAVMTAVIANGGAIPHPHVVKKIGSVTIMPGKPRQAGLKQRTIRLIRQGMYDAVHGEGGTAHRVAMEDVKVAGKTGTAQNPQGKAHGWFTAFAPFDDPKLCVAVFVEHGGSGGVEPADIAGAVFAEAKKRGLL